MRRLSMTRLNQMWANWVTRLKFSCQSLRLWRKKFHSLRQISPISRWTQTLKRLRLWPLRPRLKACGSAWIRKSWLRTKSKKIVRESKNRSLQWQVSRKLSPCKSKQLKSDKLVLIICNWYWCYSSKLKTYKFFAIFFSNLSYFMGFWGFGVLGF